ncbi:hypothetical protein OpiT1DRAFT_01093 [Opitutaceae bacterium TAV1]|nr:hypothetical protein OpiT1DRAFT_01093 [Opitutaceae bacterium TAV1]
MKTHRHPRLFPAIAAVLALAAATASAGAQTTSPVFSDDFSTNTRANWYSSGASGTVTWATGGLTLSPTGPASGKHVVTYFDTTSLGLDESLRLELKFTVGGTTAADQLRVGLLYSGAGAPHVAGDNHGLGGNGAGTGVTGGFDTYVGYRMNAALATSMAWTKRTSGKGAAALLTDNTAFTSSSVTTSHNYDSSTHLTSGQTYTLIYTLTRTAASTVSFEAVLSGVNSENASFAYTATGSNTAYVVSAFDTLGIGLNNSTVDFTITGVTITHVSAIPEPAATASGFSLVTLVGILVMSFRKRR